MKKITYRLCTLLLVVSLVFSANTVIAEEESFVPMTSQEFSVLKEAELLTDDFLNMSANSSVTRAEFLGAVYKLAGYSDITMENPFTDVDDATPYKNAISYFYNTGVINGTSSTTFSPYNAISCRQAVSILVKFLGYQAVTRVTTGTENDYLAAAYKFGLLKGVKVDSFDSALTAEAAVVLLYNCAVADLVDVLYYTGEGNTTSYINENSCILSERHGIKYARGTVSIPADGKLQLEEKIIIDDTVYLTGGRDFSEYLGYSVKFFYKEDGSNKILFWMYPEAVNSVLTLDSEELMTDDREYNYDKIVYKENGKKRTVARVDAYADIIYNYTVSNNATIDMIKPSVGSITLVDNNGDTIYDTVIVKEYRNLFVYGTSVDENFIAGRYGDSIDLDDYENVKIIKDGEEIDFNSINNNCVVSYLASPDKKYLYVYVNDIGVKETLVSRSIDSDETIYEFESGEYFVADSLNNVIAEGKYEVPEIKTGRTYWYYLDVRGRIAAITEADDDAEQYAFLVEVREVKDFGGWNKVGLEIVLEDGTHTYIETADKMEIDGVKNKKGTDITIGEVGEVVKVSFNKDGEVKSIDFAETLDETAHPFGYDKTNFTLDYPEVNELYYRNYLFANRFAVGADTVCFAVFTNKDGTKEYDVLPMNAISSNATYTNVKIYDCDEYRDIGALCMNYNRRDSFNSGFILVDTVKYVLGDDGNYYPQITGLVKGSPVTYTLTHDDVLSEANVKRGDIVRCSTYLNEVYRVEIVCRLSDQNAPLIDTTNLANQSDSRVLGYLYSNNGNNIVLYNPDGWTYGGKLLVTRTTTPLSNLSISVYDKNTDSVYVGSAKDLYHTSAPQLDGSIFLEENAKKVFIYRENTTVGQIIVAQY